MDRIATSASASIEPGAGTVDGRPHVRPALLLTMLEVADLLGVGRTTVYELISSGELEVVHIGRAARVPTASVHAYVARLRVRAGR